MTKEKIIEKIDAKLQNEELAAVLLLANAGNSKVHCIIEGGEKAILATLCASAERDKEFAALVLKVVYLLASGLPEWRKALRGVLQKVESTMN